ncbi:MAG: outer membrane protein assembly factor BamD [Desulfarculaceae bacterium]|nr:outer membrane protein assembly factor BamD [Desulfarculaceae bacterium]MCF8071070.1 outer membrane protein assembly factor BamD [Desulfarculaceae bacterium]MCF8100658.1 outer membrane protein assembly factor BamD [Desulfarculaceae bacterium]MCF8116908.1 outer membrane protein assembly factor BamD [Desulfarculaceae bacterium]
MTKHWRVVALALLLALAAAGGCGMFGSGGGTSDEAFDTPAQVLANEAETLYREGNYDESANLFQALKDRFPYSRFALLADLRVGDAYFKSKRYEEAVLAYEDFIRLHPKNDAVPYAIYQMGMVYFDQMLTPDRDPENARKAMQTFQRLIKQYPKSEWAVRSQPRLQEATRRLAAHDMVVGKYYLNTKAYRAAMGRFKRVLTQYPDVGLYNEAMGYLQQAQKKWAALPAKEREGQGIDRRDLNAPVPGMEAPDVLSGPDNNPL